MLRSLRARRGLKCCAALVGFSSSARCESWASQQFLRDIPKTDLHVHLDGSLRLTTLLELSKEQGSELPAWTEEGLRVKVFKERYGNLVEYLAGFRYTCSVMNTPTALERIAYEFAVSQSQPLP